MDHKQFQQALSLEINKMCELAISEDLNGSAGIDVSAQLIPANTNANANLITRDHAIVCGTEWLDTVFKLLGDDVVIDWKVKDGDRVVPSQLLCELKGNARQMLTGERSAMNFLQSLSSTATMTDQYLQFLKGTDCQLLDTRKTIPGMRFGQKYAVTCGGGKNHRFGLHDAFLIKENHIMACGGIKEALSKAIELHPEKLLEIEVESLAELQQAIEGKAQVVMLDNFTTQELVAAREIVQDKSPEIKLEASGNVNPQTISEIANTGVDFISVGALTKDIKAVDLSLRVNLIK